MANGFSGYVGYYIYNKKIVDYLKDDVKFFTVNVLAFANK